MKTPPWIFQMLRFDLVKMCSAMMMHRQVRLRTPGFNEMLLTIFQSLL